MTDETSEEVVDAEPVGESREIALVTGEALDLAQPTPALAAAAGYVKQLEVELKRAKALLDEELLARMDEDAAWTIHAPGGFTLVAPSPEAHQEWDVEGLARALEDLADEGAISQAALDAALEYPKPKPKIIAKGVNALMKKPGMREALSAFRLAKASPRRVTVKEPPR